MEDLYSQNEFSRDAWEANAEVWDARMGDDGNDFVNLLQWPEIDRLLAPGPGQRILEVACGNGVMTRRLAAAGVQVTAFDFSSELIARARQRGEAGIDYRVLDATDEPGLLSLPHPFDSALSNMALFDIADVEPLFRAMSKLLKPGGAFVFTIVHPAFNNPSSAHVVEESDMTGEIVVQYAIKTTRYMTPFASQGLALRNQPKPQMYFHRPISYYLNLGFANGMLLDGFSERAFSPEVPQTTPLGWGGKFSELPPVLVARMRRV